MSLMNDMDAIYKQLTPLEQAKINEYCRIAGTDFASVVYNKSEWDDFHKWLNKGF